MGRDEDLDKELQFHIDSRIADLIAEGLTPEEARRRTRLEFGGVIQTKEAVRDQHLWSIVDGLLQDLRLAFRTLRATPIVTAVAILSLALGIGANTAIFSLVNSLMLRALPVKDPARLVLVKGRESATLPGVELSRVGAGSRTARALRRRRRLFADRTREPEHQGRRANGRRSDGERYVLRDAGCAGHHRPDVLRG